MGNVAYFSYLLPPSARDREWQGQHLLQRQRRDFPTNDATFQYSPRPTHNLNLETQSYLVHWCGLGSGNCNWFPDFSLEICRDVGEKSSSQVLQYFAQCRNKCRKKTVFSICCDMKTSGNLQSKFMHPYKKRSGRGCGRQNNRSFIQKAE